MSEKVESGTLYICGTPIGNLNDISVRTINILKGVNFIACEDTRQTIKLLNHFEINTKLISYHEHNELKRSDEIIDRLIQGESCALVSDAGMPVISDPGGVLVNKAIANNISVIPVAGPSAFLLTLISSGFNVEKFIYNGFFSKEKKNKKKEIELLINERRVNVFYESPYRIIETLELLKFILNDRHICVGRELTKKFEEFVRGDISYVLEYFKLNEPRGEFCIVIDGDKTNKSLINQDEYLEEQIKKLTLNGLSKKEISKILAAELNISSKEIYNMMIKNK